ncbi:unnamed protein product, partial [marine sediment metagenome]
LEKLAELMESPEFQEFVRLLAEDLADAAIAIADWFINSVIPAIQDFLAEVNNAGGPVEWFKKKWEELKTKIQGILAILRGDVEGTATGWRKAMQSVVTFFVKWWTFLLKTFEKIIIGIIKVFWKIADVAPEIVGTIKAAFITWFLVWKSTLDIFFLNPIRDVMNAAKEVFLEAAESIRMLVEIGKALWESFTSAVKLKIEELFTAIQARFGVSVPGVFSRAIDSIKGMWDGLKISIITILNSAAQAA